MRTGMGKIEARVLGGRSLLGSEKFTFIEDCYLEGKRIDSFEGVPVCRSPQ